MSDHGDLRTYAIAHDALFRILIVASSVFYYGEGRFRSNSQDPASLFDAHDLLSRYVGKRMSQACKSNFFRV